MKKKSTNTIYSFLTIKKVFVVAICMVMGLLNIPTQLFAQENAVSFLRSQVTGLTINRPTSLQFGPDNRLYISQVNGLIKAFTIERVAAGQYAVTATENINLVQNIPNHNDDGTLNTNVNNRQVLGLLVKGTAANPVLYVSSNDPRTGGGNGDLNLDTNSGIISKLSKNAQGNWVKIDLIRGLPKSEHNHATNGLQIDEVNNVLYIAQGGHANKGAPSHELAWLPEYAYSAAILEVDLDVIEALPTQGAGNTQYKYDLPTLTGVGPFGGNNGLNQAILIQGGPVQIYAPGFRNAYDIVLSEEGKLYTWDNSSNANWGVPPIMRTADNLATNITERDFNDNVDNIQATHYKINDNVTYFDPFHYISHKGYYGGNPNPTRANPSINTFNSLPAVPDGFDFGFTHGTNTAAGLENNFIHSGRNGIPKQNQSLFGVMGSTNGLAEYRASNFGNVMKGSILGTSFNGILYRVVLNANGTDLDNTLPHNGSGINGVIHLAEGFGTWNILDVAAQGDADIYPGTIWIAEYTQNKITILEPNDFNECVTRNPNDFPSEDFDGDGFTNQDEISNGTDPCSPASIPNDWDNDLLSNLNDSDDDNDGILDINDAFALDAQNGTDTYLPIEYEWEATNSDLAGYILNSGFSGLMINNQDNYQSLFDVDNMTVIGTGGLFTVSTTTAGTTLGNSNNQEYGFQFGLNAGAYPGNYMFHTSITKPFENLAISGMTNQNMGLHIGLGDQSNYLHILTDANNGTGGIRVIYELNDVIQNNTLYPISILGQQNINLYLLVDKATNQIQPAYAINNNLMTNLGTPITVPSAWLEGVLATGVVSTAGTGTPIGATWEFFKVIPIPSTSQASVTIDSGNDLASSTIAASSFKVVNNSPNGQKITQLVIDLSTTVFPDMVFDPANSIEDTAIPKGFSIDAGETATGFMSFQYTSPHLGDVANGYDKLIVNFNDFALGESFEFSIDTDPLSIKTTSPPNENGQVSGLELLGASASVIFDDGSGHISQLYRQSTSLGSSTNLLKQQATKSISIRAVDVNNTPAEVTNPNQTIRIEGDNGTQVKLLVLEGGLFKNGLTDGGFNLQPYLANRLLKIVDEKTATLSNNGNVELAITLSRTDLGNVETGIHYIVAVAIDSDGSTSILSNVIKLILRAGPPVASYRINSGGPAYTTLEGAAFSVDGNFSTSTAYNPNTGLAIADTEDDLLYNSERYGNNFTYNLPVSSGNYQVILHFAEIYYGVAGRGGVNTGAGSRVFDVNIEGNNVLDNFDIFAEAGASAKAITRSFFVNITDGQLNINFVRVTDNAKISAIEIIPMGSNTPPILSNPLVDYQFPYDPDLENPFSFQVPANTFSDLQNDALTYTATQVDGSPLPDWLNFNISTATFSGFASQYQVAPNFVDVKVTAFDGQGLSTFDVFRITLLDPTIFGVQRINTGKTTGVVFSSIDGHVFQNDTHVTGGTIYNIPNAQIANTDDDELYRTERYGNMTYNIPVSDGTYQVILHFSENYFGITATGGVGSRVFNVDLEGVRRLTNFDIFSEAGGAATAIQRNLFVEINDGSLNLQFISVTNNALINAIEIVPFAPTLTLQSNLNTVLAGTPNRKMLRVEIPNFEVNAARIFNFNTQGTSQAGDILKAKLFYTGTNPNFITPSMLGEVNTPNGNFSFTGLNQTLNTGSNYFWLVYDSSPTATLGNALGAECLSVELNNTTVSVANPQSFRSTRVLIQTDRKSGKLIDFDGNNDFITLPNEEKFDFTNQMTVETWVKIDAFNRNWQAIVTKGDNSWRLHRNNNTNKLNFAFTSSTGALQEVNSITDLNDGKWHHVAGVYTGTQLQIYIDGVKEAELNTTVLIRNNDQPVMIGSNSERNNRFFRGQIDEVRIWDIARTQAEIRQNMHLTSKGNETGLISYLQLNEEAGNIAYDLVSELNGTWSAGMTAANRIDATMPVGGGVAFRANASAQNNVEFTDTDINITFGATAPEGEVVISKLEALSPAMIDPANAETKNADYWIINNYGSKDNLSEMTLRFYLPVEFLLNSDLGAYKMYKRSSNAHNEAWQMFEASALNLDENYLEFSGITSFSQILLGSDNSSLPVSLVSLEASRQSATQVTLNWTTILEDDNKGFEIEKSLDAINFTKIGFVEGAGNHIGRKSYEFVDNNAPNLSYYRLKQIDLDGKFTHSFVVVVDGTDQDFIQVYPNPVSIHNLQTLKIKGGDNTLTQSRITLEVIDKDGRNFEKYQGTLAELETKLKEEISQWASGLYILRFQTENGKSTVSKIVKY